MVAASQSLGEEVEVDGRVNKTLVKSLFLFPGHIRELGQTTDMLLWVGAPS